MGQLALSVTCAELWLTYQGSDEVQALLCARFDGSKWLEATALFAVNPFAHLILLPPESLNVNACAAAFARWDEAAARVFGGAKRQNIAAGRADGRRHLAADLRVTIECALVLASARSWGVRGSEPRPELLTRRSCELRRQSRLAHVDNLSREGKVSCHPL